MMMMSTYYHRNIFKPRLATLRVPTQSAIAWSKDLAKLYRSHIEH
jgi:hypothetical protein